MKRKKEGHNNSERWLLTYSDLITLLMIFFVVMYALSNVDVAKYKQISESLRIAMGGGKTIIGNEDAANVSSEIKPVDDNQTSETEKNKMEDLKKSVDKYLEQNGLSQSVTTKIDERGLVVSINDTLFFDTGKADIKPEYAKKLIEIGKILSQLNNYIRIEGHTDNIPISNGAYSSNWQLSAARAANVTELLVTQAGIAPQKLSAVGYGEFRPIGDNSTEDGRLKNRRVDIIIINSKYNEIENNQN